MGGRYNKQTWPGFIVKNRLVFGTRLFLKHIERSLSLLAGYIER